jgi:hypothetical protein
METFPRCPVERKYELSLCQKGHVVVVEYGVLGALERTQDLSDNVGIIIVK